MIQRKAARTAWIAMLSMVSFLFTSLAAPYFSNPDPSFAGKQETCFSIPLHNTSQADKQIPLEGSEKEEESRTDRSEQSFLVVFNEEISTRFASVDISRITFFVRSAEISHACIPLYITQRSFLI